jgi:hypothetical protein
VDYTTKLWGVTAMNLLKAKTCLTAGSGGGQEFALPILYFV